jgi:flagellar FliJ protein
MKKFRFSLEAVLTLKKMKEEEAFRDLSVFVSEINEMQNRKQKNYREMEKAKDDMTSYLRKGANLDSYKPYEEYIKFLENININMDSEIEKRQPDLEIARGKLIEAQKEKKVLELLKENRKRKWQRKRNREENREELELWNQMNTNDMTIDKPEKIQEGVYRLSGDVVDKDEGLPENFKMLRDYYKKFMMNGR